MPGAVTRMEYFWLQGRVVQRRTERDSGYGPWPRSPDERHRVASIEDRDGGMDVQHGPAFTRQRLADAVLLHKGLPPSDVVPGLDIRLPAALIRQLEDRVVSAVNNVTARYGRLGSEDRTTGVFFDRIEGQLRDDDWSVTITAHHYSAVVKEKRVGADAGIVIDIKARDGGRVYKALLIQAKRSDSVPDDVEKLPRVRRQRQLMREYTSEGYVWVYTPEGMSVFGPNDTHRPLDPGNVLADALRCSRGDRDGKAIANAFDSQHVLEVMVSP